MDSSILAIDGWMSEPELDWLLAQALSVKPGGLIIEIGAWLGRSSAALYKGVGNDKTIVTIDTWLGQPDLRETDHRLAQEANLLQLYLENMHNLEFVPQPFSCFSDLGIYFLVSDSLEAASLVPDSSVALWFDDGDHNILKANIQAWKPKMVDGGKMSGHDFSPAFPAIEAAVLESFDDVQSHDTIWSAVI